MIKIWILALSAAILFGLTACMEEEQPLPTEDPSSVPSPAEEPAEEEQKEDSIPEEWLDGGIFSSQYHTAFELLSRMTQEEKIGQLFISRCPDENAEEQIRSYAPAGFVLFGRDFAGKSREQVSSTIASYQQASQVPMIMAVDEEGGQVVRVSSNPQLWKGPFPSPMWLYQHGGLEAIEADGAAKAQLLTGLGINMNLAPVCDVSTNPQDYIYGRTLGKGPEEVSAFAETAVKTAAEHGLASCLKHFPGYGPNVDTHTGIAIDKRPWESFTECDFLPFSAGIKAGAEAVLVSHNIAEAMDDEVPASLSPKVHQVLRQELEFTGLIMTDDLIMEAIGKYTGAYHPAVAAVLAGNDLVLVSDLPGSVEAVAAAVQEGIIPMETVDHTVFRVLAMKLYCGMIQ